MFLSKTDNFQANLLDLHMGLKQVLPLSIRVNLRVIAMKR